VQSKPTTTTAPDAIIEPLWPAGAPGALGGEPGDIPTLTFYRAAGNDGATIIVCPGGGYQNLAHHEGEPVARWLNSLGINAFVLKYRLAPRYHHPAMMNDVLRALRVLRFNAKNQGLDPDRIGVLGFSAGGHLAATACTLYENGNADAKDPIDRVSSRPDLGVLVYPVISLNGAPAHKGSRRNLLGDNPTQEQIDSLSLEKHVNEKTPPAFLFHTFDDPGVPVANSILYAQALHAAGVAVELHCFEHGRHGVGLASNDPILSAWTTLCANWLMAHQFGHRANL
jgi:acetyl esterase/lipase